MSYLHVQKDPENLEGLIEEGRRRLREDGLGAGLRWLNQRVEHRFTGVYRFDDPWLRNVLIFDRENPALEIADDAEMDATFCSIVGRTRSPFSTADATRDERVADHRAGQDVQAYSGVLLRDEAGEPFGSLCHFDTRPCEMGEREIPLMQALAPGIFEALQRERRATTR